MSLPFCLKETGRTQLEQVETVNMAHPRQMGFSFPDRQNAVGRGGLTWWKE